MIPSPAASGAAGVRRHDGGHRRALRDKWDHSEVKKSGASPTANDVTARREARRSLRRRAAGRCRPTLRTPPPPLAVEPEPSLEAHAASSDLRTCPTWQNREIVASVAGPTFRSDVPCPYRRPASAAATHHRTGRRRLQAVVRPVHSLGTFDSEASDEPFETSSSRRPVEPV